MLRKEGFKLIVYPKAKKVRLFDLDKDPLEMQDLAEDPALLPKIKEMFGELLGLQKELGDELDLSEVFPELM